MSDLAEESPGLAQGIIAVESSLPATFLYQRKHRVDRWCCDLHEAAQFLDGGDECIDLEGSASFEILQHRNFVTDDGTGCACEVVAPGVIEHRLFKRFTCRRDRIERLLEHK
jgi:hypothetical protein